MAAATASQVTKLYTEGSGEVATLFRLRNITTADTFDFSSFFTYIKCATWCPAGQKTTGVVGSLSGSPATVVTFTLSGLANDEIYVLCVGQAAS